MPYPPAAACLNDVHGFGDPGLYPLLAASQCRLIVMHAVQAAGAATRVVTDASAVRDGIRRFFTHRLAALQAAGISRDRLVIDPGLGYFLGSTPGPSLAALAGIRELKDTFGVPVMVSPSRKSFLRAVTGRDVNRSGPTTLTAEIFAAWQGADYIRTQVLNHREGEDQVCRHLKFEAVQVRRTCVQVRPGARRNRALKRAERGREQVDGKDIGAGGELPQQRDRMAADPGTEVVRDDGLAG